MIVHDIPWQLLEKHFANETNTQENKKVQEWIGNASENTMIFAQLQHYYQTSGSLPTEFMPDTKAALEKISKKTDKTVKLAPISSWWWKVAAIFLLGICSWWLVNQHGKNQASDLTAILKADTTITTITLADGSRVWLNAHSFIQYPPKFGNSREIYLEGEAYFEIAHDAKHPFIVRTPGAMARVLGTKFDIRSYPSEKQTKLIVTQGKVGFNNSRNNQVILTANQKGTIDKQTGNITQSDNDNCNFMAWKTLEFQFDNQPLEVVVATLADVYHFKYKFEEPNLKKRLLTANFKHRPLHEIIQTISLATNVQVPYQNGTYSIR